MNSSWNTHSNAQSANANRNINQQKKPQKKAIRFKASSAAVQSFVLPFLHKHNRLICYNLWVVQNSHYSGCLHYIADSTKERDTTQHQSKVEQFFPLMPFGIKWAEYQHPIAASSSYHIMLQKKWEINNFMEFWAAAALQGNKKR